MHDNHTEEPLGVPPTWSIPAVVLLIGNAFPQPFEIFPLHKYTSFSLLPPPPFQHALNFMIRPEYGAIRDECENTRCFSYRPKQDQKHSHHYLISYTQADTPLLRNMILIST